MKHSFAFVLMMAVVLAAAALSGCTSQPSPSPPVTNTPLPAAPPVNTPVVTGTPPLETIPAADEAAADRDFVGSLEGCYAQTPVITNISTRVTFTTCIQGTPNPRGTCAVDYKNNVQRYLKGDDTTAGYTMANNGMTAAKAAYQQGMAYDYVNDRNVPCGTLPQGFPLT
jgi:hypothetical protein